MDGDEIPNDSHPQSPRERETDWSVRSQEPSTPRPIDDVDDDMNGVGALLSPGQTIAEEEEESVPRFPLPAMPLREEPTLKERLVERERQARVETERARLKRQFALSMNGGAAAEDDVQASREHGSVVGTVGEGSSVAAHAAESKGQDEDNMSTNEKLGYAMERFLSEGGAAVGVGEAKEPEPEQGVVMERFLAGPAVLAGDDAPMQEEEIQDITPQASSELEQNRWEESRLAEESVGQHRPLPVSISMEVNADTETQDGSEVEAAAGSARSYSTMSNDGTSTGLDDLRSMTILPPTLEDDVENGVLENLNGEALSLPSDSRERASSADSSRPHSDRSTRYLRLTEAEIQEMAAIEEASIGNAPPSDREENLSQSSLVGDLRDFEGMTHEGVGTFSERTHTTALESVSMNSVGMEQGGQPSIDTVDENTVGEIEGTSVSSRLELSTGGSSSDVSVTVMPPSDIAREEPPPSLILDEEIGVVPQVVGAGAAGTDEPRESAQTSLTHIQSAPTFQDTHGNLDAKACAAANVGIVNRRIRPGLVQSPPQRTRSLPPKLPVQIDGFDFDKDAIDRTPRSTGLDSLNDLPSPGIWSPQTTMNVSPLRPALLNTLTVPKPSTEKESRRVMQEDLVCPDLNIPDRSSLDYVRHDNYGATEPPSNIPHRRELMGLPMSIDVDEDSYTARAESRPLLSKVVAGEKEMVQNIFDEVYDESTATIGSDVDDCEQYRKSTILERAFPDRMFALLVTLIVEIPVLLMISGGSDRLCMLVGRRRYQLMMGFLPLSSAISGNVGLQASSLTTRAISHYHVTKESYPVWFRAEVGTAAYLGLGMGFMLGGVAFFASGMDFAFGFTIFMAQFVSIVTAGVTGTLAPVIFTFVFHRDSGKWGGPLETAIQDIVGSFAMVYMSFQLLKMFPPVALDPSDVCGIVED